MRQKHRVLYGFAVIGLLAGLGSAGLARANGASPPSKKEVAFAQEVSNLMLNELVAALFTEFDETTPDNVEHGKQAISLIFNDLNRNMRLVGTLAPLGGANNAPSNSFETTALQLASSGQAHTAVQEENDSWFYRRSVPLSNTFHPNCVLCHADFTPEFFSSTNNPGQWVGALVLSVPIRR